MLSPALLALRRDRHSAECSSNGKQPLHFPRNPIENIIAKVLAIAPEHEHANECEGSPVKSTSKPKFAHACAKSVLKFTFEVLGRTNEATVVKVSRIEEFPHGGERKTYVRNLRGAWEIFGYTWKLKKLSARLSVIWVCCPQSVCR